MPNHLTSSAYVNKKGHIRTDTSRDRLSIGKRSFYMLFSALSAFLLTSYSRFLNILGNEVKITIDVIIPAAKSAIPSDI